MECMNSTQAKSEVCMKCMELFNQISVINQGSFSFSRKVQDLLYKVPKKTPKMKQVIPKV